MSTDVPAGLLVDWGGVLTHPFHGNLREWSIAEGLDPDGVIRIYMRDPTRTCTVACGSCLIINFVAKPVDAPASRATRATHSQGWKGF